MPKSRLTKVFICHELVGEKKNATEVTLRSIETLFKTYPKRPRDATDDFTEWYQYLQLCTCIHDAGVQTTAVQKVSCETKTIPPKKLDSAKP